MTSPLPSPHNHHAGASSFDFGGRFERYQGPPGGYADIDQQFDDLQIDSPLSGSFGTMSSTSVTGKDFIYILYERDSDEQGWTSARQTEIGAAQKDLKKKAARSKTNTAAQLQAMTANRRDLIQRKTDELTNQEVGDAIWEPICIENKDVRNGETMKKVLSFAVIFARRIRKAKKTPRPLSNVAAQPTRPPKTTTHSPKSSSEQVHAEQRRSGLFDDPFDAARLFGPQGLPVDEQGRVAFHGNDLPRVTPERPIGQPIPHIQPQPHPQQQQQQQQQQQYHQPQQHQQHQQPQRQQPNGQRQSRTHGGLFNLDTILGEGASRGTGRPREHHSANPVPRPRSTSRKRDTAYKKKGGSQYITIETRSPYDYLDDAAGSDSEEGSVIHGEYDDHSSRTSEDTHRSHRRYFQKEYKPQSRGRRRVHRGPYQRSETVIIPEGRRRPTINTRVASTQLPVKRVQPKPVLHQQPPSAKKSASPTVPPPAPEPPSFYTNLEREKEKEKEKEKRADDYMRDSIKEQDQRRWDEELRQREHEVKIREMQAEEQARRSATTLTSPTNRTSRQYTFDPRDSWTS